MPSTLPTHNYCSVVACAWWRKTPAAHSRTRTGKAVCCSAALPYMWLVQMAHSRAGRLLWGGVGGVGRSGGWGRGLKNTARKQEYKRKQAKLAKGKKNKTKEEIITSCFYSTGDTIPTAPAGRTRINTVREPQSPQHNPKQQHGRGREGKGGNTCTWIKVRGE